MENNDTLVPFNMTNEIDKGEIGLKSTLVSRNDYLELMVLERLIEEALAENIKPEIRDAYLICARLNYSEMYKKYYSWVDKYIDLTRPNEDNLIKIDVLYDLNANELKSKKVISLNVGNLEQRNNELNDIIHALHESRNDCIRYQEIIGKLDSYMDLIEMFYPELYGLVDKNKENKISR